MRGVPGYRPQLQRGGHVFGIGLRTKGRRGPRTKDGQSQDRIPAPEDITKYHSRVVWREKLSGNVVFMRYGIGVKHCQDLEEFLRLFGY